MSKTHSSFSKSSVDTKKPNQNVKSVQPIPKKRPLTLTSAATPTLTPIKHIPSLTSLTSPTTKTEKVLKKIKVENNTLSWTRWVEIVSKFISLEKIQNVVLQYLHYNPHLGLFIHWGLYAVPAYDSVDSAKRRQIQNGSEWYLKRLMPQGSNDRYPTSGSNETRQFHQKQYQTQDPSSYYSLFTPRFFPIEPQKNTSKSSETCVHPNIQKWVQTCVKLGASYAVLTSKHHDGFCLWPTQSQTTPEKKSITIDVVQQFKNACRKAGIRFGLYYSWMEFNREFDEKYMSTVVKPQLDELVHYQPDILWYVDLECDRDELNLQIFIKSVALMGPSTMNYVHFL